MRRYGLVRVVSHVSTKGTPRAYERTITDRQTDRQTDNRSNVTNRQTDKRLTHARALTGRPRNDFLCGS